MQLLRISMSLFLTLACMLLPWASATSSELSLWTVHGNYQAAFPGRPVFFGEMSAGELRIRAYTYPDHERMLAYSTNATQKPLAFSERDLGVAIKNWVMGDVRSVGGNLDSEDIGRVNGVRGAKYRYSYMLGDIPVLKCSAVIFYDGKFVSWAVQGSPRLGGSDPCQMFERYVAYFGPR